MAASWRVLHRRVEDFKVWKGIKFSACLTDPPYHLQGGFMGADWDKGGIAFNPDTWRLLASHLLPGAFGMAFASARGWHRLACAIEDAGLRIHPSIFGWVYGQGFCKATRIDTQVDKAAGAKRKQTGVAQGIGSKTGNTYSKHSGFKAGEIAVTAPATDLARAWAGHRYGLQALKPALEPIIVWQKPYSGKAVDSITRTGAGALNIEGGRLGTDRQHKDKCESVVGLGSNRDGSCYGDWRGERELSWTPGGRWPANFALQHDARCRRVGVKKVRTGKAVNKNRGGGKRAGYGGYEIPDQEPDATYAGADGLETTEEWNCVESCPVRRLDEQSGERGGGFGKRGGGKVYCEGGSFRGDMRTVGFGDSGGASRFFFNSDWSAEIEEGLLAADPAFYCAKAGRKERDAGLDKRCSHPTVKPIKLCRWLATLLLPPAAYAPRRLLVPFAGVGSEMIGAMQAGWEEVLGIESEQEYVEIAEARLRHWTKVALDKTESGG